MWTVYPARKIIFHAEHAEIPVVQSGNMNALDFLAIGDTVVDDFIRLKDAEVHCDIDKQACTICMRFADKIPFESSTRVYGVGNAANAAVAAARLGLQTGFVSHIGNDDNGKLILKHFKNEKVDTSFVEAEDGVATNYHYVLWYGDDRTILVKHEAYRYAFPADIPPPKCAYLSSLASGTEAYHDEVAEWLEKNPGIFFGFQPGTFQIKLGAEKLARLYRRADIFFANKEEYQRILGSKETDEGKLLASMHALGPKIAVLTDGRNGVYALKDGTVVHLDMFPDPAPPVNRTGAGDAFSSTTTAYLMMGMPLEDAMKRGTINSAYVVQGIGAQARLLTKDELESKLKIV
jgi:sugar/nucleoside kinase (ribokinase family)